MVYFELYFSNVIIYAIFWVMFSRVIKIIWSYEQYLRLKLPQKG